MGHDDVATPARSHGTAPLAVDIAGCFSSEAVSPATAAALKELLPGATFVRASLRCGTGLFVTDDLLHHGHHTISVVSLANSLAGVAMKQGRPLLINLFPFSSGAATTRVACVPVSVAAPEGTHYRPLFLGALIVGVAGEVDAPLADGLAALATGMGPALLSVGMAGVQHLAHLLSLRDRDAEMFEEEELQDLPMDVARPPSSGAGGTGLPLHPLALPQGAAQVQEAAKPAAGAAAAKPPTDDAAQPFFRRPSAASPPKAGSGRASTQHLDSLAGARGRDDNTGALAKAPRAPAAHAPPHNAMQLGAAMDAARSALLLVASLCLVAASQPQSWLAMAIGVATNMLILSLAFRALAGGHGARVYFRWRPPLMVLEVIAFAAAARGSNGGGRSPLATLLPIALNCMLQAHATRGLGASRFDTGAHVPC